MEVEFVAVVVTQRLVEVVAGRARGGLVAEGKVVIARIGCGVVLVVIAVVAAVG